MTGKINISNEILGISTKTLEILIKMFEMSTKMFEFDRKARDFDSIEIFKILEVFEISRDMFKILIEMVEILIEMYKLLNLWGFQSKFFRITYFWRFWSEDLRALWRENHWGFPTEIIEDSGPKSFRILTRSFNQTLILVPIDVR